MSKIKYGSIGLAVVALILLLTASGAFSAVEADRPLQVSVVEDDEAYLAIEKQGEEKDGDVVVTGSEDEEDVKLATVTNQFSDEIKITLTQSTDDAIKLNGTETETELDPDDTASLSADCPGDEGTLEFGIEAETTGDESHIEVETDERTVTLECEDTDDTNDENDDDGTDDTED